MGTRWLDESERSTWLRLVAVLELLPGVLDTQLRRDADLTHFEYFVMAMLSEAPKRTLQMAKLAMLTNATLPRLSHVVRRMEQRELVRRLPSPEDGRVTNAQLTMKGWHEIVVAAPGHVETVRALIFDGLSKSQVTQLGQIMTAVLARLDPERRLTGLYDPKELAEP
jgi:DNA-binding MarR family transcriptional regulator